MEDIIMTNSPNTVAADLLAPLSSDTVAKMRPPILRAMSERLGVPFSRSSSMPVRDANTAAKGASSRPQATAQDDIDVDRRSKTMADFQSANLTISDSTRRILERMSDNQLNTAKMGLANVRQKRRSSGLIMGSVLKGKRLSMVCEGEHEGRRSSRQPSFQDNDLDDLNELDEIEEGVKLALRRSSGGSGGSQGGRRRNTTASAKRLSSDGEGEGEGRRFCKSMGPLTHGTSDEDSFSDSVEAEGDDEEEDEMEKQLAQVTIYAPKKKGGEGTTTTKAKGHSMSMGPLGNQDSFDFSDEEEEETDTKEQNAKAAFDGETELQNAKASLISNNRLGQEFLEVAEMADETFTRIVRHNSDASAQSVAMSLGGNDHGPSRRLTEDSTQSLPVMGQLMGKQPPHRRPARQRRNGLASMSASANNSPGSATASDFESAAPRAAWKPLSGVTRSKSDEVEDIRTKAKEEAQAAERQGGGGFGGLWNKLTTSFTSESSVSPLPLSECSANKTPSEPKTEISGATYFRRGKRKASKCQFLQAVALYNFALVRQREELGENHIDCGTTLNEIGVCWMMMGEAYPAMTAFEEALFIRQKHLGDGAMEVAETTNNIWMILHEERREMEGI